MSATRDQRIADEYLGDYLQCPWCGQREDRETLSRGGMRCGPCYEAYLAEIKPGRPVSRNEALQMLRGLSSNLGDRSKDPREWARRLQRREIAGERLSQLQRQWWREALRLPADAPANTEVKES